MSLRDMLRRAWRKFELFAYAMDYDEPSQTAALVAGLEARVRQQAADVAVISARMDRLTAQAQSAERDPPL